jgi:hypothetical protein
MITLVKKPSILLHLEHTHTHTHTHTERERNTHTQLSLPIIKTMGVFIAKKKMFNYYLKH